MRVAHVIAGRCNPDSANGVDKTVFYLSLHQARLGAHVAIFSFSDKEPIPIPGVEIKMVEPPRHGKLGSKIPYVGSEVVQELVFWKPGMVHFHSVHIGPFIAMGKLLRKWRIPYVVTPHGGFAPGRLARVGPQVRAYIRLLEKAYLEGARFIHAVSRNDEEGLRSLGVRANVVVVPNGIDPTLVADHVDAELLRRRFPQLGGKRIFLFLGRLDPVPKGLDLLLQAFAMARPANAALVLVGPDWRENLRRLQDKAQELNVGDRVVFAGPAYGREKWSCLAATDVFVHTSRWEGFSFSVLEAMAMGKPVLVSRPADPGDIGDYGAGVRVEPQVDQIAEALRTFANLSSEHLKRMGQRSRSLVEQGYNWQGIVAQLLEAYNNPGEGRRLLIND